MQEQVSSRAPTFGNCYIPQADMEETELGSRAATLGVYYPTQQNVQGVGFNCTFATLFIFCLFEQSLSYCVLSKTVYCSSYSGSSH